MNYKQKLHNQKLTKIKNYKTKNKVSKYMKLQTKTTHNQKTETNKNRKLAKSRN